MNTVDEGCGPGCTCGAPARDQFVTLGATVSAAAEASAPTQPRHPITQAEIPAGTFLMGDSSGDRNAGDGETPLHEVTLPAFSIDATTVTNDAFAAFIADTGYRTEAETFGFSAVFHLALAAPEEDILGQPPGTPWWFGVRGADWAHPGGRESDI